jgi:hypothetical protein
MAYHGMTIFFCIHISASSSAGISRPHPAEEFLSLQPNDTVSVLERQTGEWQGSVLAQHGPEQGLVQLELLDAQAKDGMGSKNAPKMGKKDA